VPTTSPPRVATVLGTLLVPALLAAAGCAEELDLRPAPRPSTPVYAVPEYDAARDLAPGRAALALVPADATEVTVTDFDEVRTELGVPDLTSADLMTDRNAFWERAPQETVLLTDGMLRDDTSTLMLDHGFTQDDIDWEAHFRTPEGPGWVVAFRPDLDMGAVRGAVAADVAGLGAGVVDAARHLVSAGAVAPGEESWGDREDVEELSDPAPAQSTYYRSACIPVADALGPDADVEDLEQLTSRHDVTTLEPVEAFGVSFADGVATARLGVGRLDLFERQALAEDWPAVGDLGFGDGFARPTVDPSTGRIGHAVVSPPVAARLTLTDLLPFAVCDEVTPMEEPTGL
jgi:hypothetical protein